MTYENVNYSVRLTQAERAKLQRLADQSGRQPSEVMRRLLSLVDDIPELKHALGIWEPKWRGDK